MAIGRTFKEAFQKGMRGLEVGKAGWDSSGACTVEALRAALAIPTAARVFQLKDAFVAGLSVQEIASLTKIDPWFLQQMKELVDFEKSLLAQKTENRGQKTEDREQKTEIPQLLKKKIFQDYGRESKNQLVQKNHL